MFARIRKSHPVAFTLGTVLSLPAALFLLYAAYTIAQSPSSVTIQGTNLLVPGNVGIGTASPGAKLDIRGALKFGDDNGYIVGAPIYGVRINNNTDTLNVIIANNDGSVIIPSGNVGIGTASPGTKLDVQGVNNGNGIRLRNTAGSGIADLYPDSTGNSILELFSSTGVSQVLFRSEGSNSYIASGNVGIGTASPQSKLQVSGDYIQIPTRTNAPPSADCDSSSEYGRMVINETSRRFYICTDSGWDYKMFDNK